MAAKSFLRVIGNLATEVFGVQTSVGAGNAGDIPALGDDGRLHSSMMPTGIGADTAEVEASEALADGDYVNIWDDGGSAKVRKADASTAGKHAHGFVLASVSQGNNATVYFEGPNSHVSGQAAGDVFLSTTPGAGTSTAPTGSGNVLQRIGYAVSATEVNFDASSPIVRA